MKSAELSTTYDASFGTFGFMKVCDPFLTNLGLCMAGSEEALKITYHKISKNEACNSIH